MKICGKQFLPFETPHLRNLYLAFLHNATVNVWKRYYNDAHFTDEETEAQIGELTKCKVTPTVSGRVVILTEVCTLLKSLLFSPQL